MRYLLIAHTDDGPRTAQVTEYATEADRDLASCRAMEGDGWEGSPEEIDYLLRDLREDGWMRFEGDPPLQWVDASDYCAPGEPLCMLAEAAAKLLADPGSPKYRDGVREALAHWMTRNAVPQPL